MTKPTKSISFNSDQLAIVIDAMEGFDVCYQYDGDEKIVKEFDELYKRLLAAYRKL